MFDKALKKMWQNAPQKEQIRFEQSRLILDLKFKINRFDQKIKWRNALEITAAIIVMLAFGYYTYVFSSFTMKAGSLYLMLWAGYVIFRLLKTRKFKQQIASTKSLKTHLVAHRQYLLKEKNLSKTILYWYFLPIIPGVSLMLSSNIYDLTSSLKVIGGFIIIIVLGYIKNQRSVNKEVQPLIEEVNEALSQLEE